MAGSTTSSTVLPMFERFRVELDEHHERRERVIKASRDITAAAKKIIFALQRIRTLQQPLPAHIIKSNTQHYDAISSQLSSISPDLQSLNTYRYSRQISGGCQEFVEAVSFEHYLTTARLLDYDAAAALIKRLDPQGSGVELSYDDYLLGVYDMTGELMKFAITAMATNGELPAIASLTKGYEVDEHTVHAKDRNVLTDMQGLRSALDLLDVGSGPFARDVEKKTDVMKASVEKVEKALYGLTVRGAERPKGWMPDTTDTGRAIEVGD